MAKVRIWVPVRPDDLPMGLSEALRLANQQPKHNWLVCEQVAVAVPESSAAEIARLKQQVNVLQRQLNLRNQKGEVMDLETQVRDTVRQGQLVHCTKEEYPRYREALQKFAAWAVDNGQTIYANISLNEVRRLDRLHDFAVRDKQGE